MKATQRKCSKCAAWNTDGEQYCHSCGAPLTADLIIKAGHEERRIQRQLRPSTKFENFVKKVKTSPNPLVRGTYFLVYGVWIVYIGILSFFLWLIAWMPG
ncbi:MAG: hypothetical protein ACI9RU_001352 [Litorivivens sp.]|jgi:hypothetical protein